MKLLPITACLITRERAWPDDVPMSFPFDEVLIANRCPNVLRRFELAQKARNEIVYVQDDDCQINIGHLWMHYDGRLTNAISSGHQQIYAGTGVTLIGFGCFFNKKQIDWSRWEAKYGPVDEMECDRVFTYLAQPHNNVVMPIRQLNRVEKMCARKGHYETRDRIIKQLKELDV